MLGIRTRGTDGTFYLCRVSWIRTHGTNGTYFCALCVVDRDTRHKGGRGLIPIWPQLRSNRSPLNARARSCAAVAYRALRARPSPRVPVRDRPWPASPTVPARPWPSQPTRPWLSPAVAGPCRMSLAVASSAGRRTRPLLPTGRHLRRRAKAGERKEVGGCRLRWRLQLLLPGPDCPFPLGQKVRGM